MGIAGRRLLALAFDDAVFQFYDGCCSRYDGNSRYGGKLIQNSKDVNWPRMDTCGTGLSISLVTELADSPKDLASGLVLEHITVSTRLVLVHIGNGLSSGQAPVNIKF